MSKNTPPTPTERAAQKYLRAGALVGIGAFVGYFGFLSTHGTHVDFVKSSSVFEVSSNTAARFTNPLLECGDIDSQPEGLVAQTRDHAETFINNAIAQKKASKIGVYYRDLNNGPWFGINSTDPFFPGSLLKVPLVMSVFEVAENNPSLLQNVVSFEGGDAGSEQLFPPSQKIEAGHTYTVEQLMDYMVRFSDNNAALLLNQIVGDKARNETYADLGISIPGSSDFEISPKKYSSFFRILYNATYLNRDYSERALTLLSTTDFNHGLRAGIPADIRLAHKFGERTFAESKEIQVHDCGIVYLPGSPFVLCIMARGTDKNDLTATISGLASLVYNDVK